MIKVMFPPGCYGTFLSKCLYGLTDISGQKQTIEFNFDNSGSSHDFRQNIDSRSYIECGHSHTMGYDSNDKLVVILPCDEHRLDYYDNQFCKQEREQMVSHLHSTFPQQEIQTKLAENWNYHHDLSSVTPRWILREWCSFWLEDCLADGYNPSIYGDIPARTYINTLDLFSDLTHALRLIADSIDAKLIATDSDIKDVQSKFISAQKLHGIQLRCDQWVDKLLQGIDTPCPCITLFDEAWVQHRLRGRGYEIKCDGLDFFPREAKEFTEIIYKV